MAKQAEEFIENPLTEMTHSELMDFIKKVRASRATPKASSPTRKKAAKKKVDKVESIVDNMSAAEIEQFKKMLLGG